MATEITPKEITASKGSGAVKERKNTYSTGVGDGRGISGEIRTEGAEVGVKGEAYADKHV